MPGTWGTFAAVPLVMVVLRGSALAQGIVAVLFMLFAIGIADRAKTLFQERDPKPIVIDEMAGFLVSLLWLPFRPLSICLGFVLFRVFDIVKPPPIGSAEKRFEGGWGIVVDDVLAGVFTNVTLRLLLLVAGLL